MKIMVTGELICSESTIHSARRMGEGWQLSWMPEHIVSGGQAIAGVRLAETVARDGQYRTRWDVLTPLAEQLGTSAPVAMQSLWLYSRVEPVEARAVVVEALGRVSDDATGAERGQLRDQVWATHDAQAAECGVNRDAWWADLHARAAARDTADADGLVNEL